MEAQGKGKLENGEKTAGDVARFPFSGLAEPVC
jgi:hypothetical protein